MSHPTLSEYQKGFVNFLVASGALTFGDFVTKSGRRTPYFVNTGKFNDGYKIGTLGSYYAAHIKAMLNPLPQVVFGPAYKGIPLAVSTVIAMKRDHDINTGFSFDRKEEKDHGDGGTIVGTPITPGTRLVIVEDVITAGTTLRLMVPLLRDTLKAEIAGVVISCDRCERGSGSKSAVSEAQDELGLSVLPLINIHQIAAYLSEPNPSGLLLNAELLGRIRDYLAEYGA